MFDNFYSISSICIILSCGALTILSSIKSKRRIQDYVWILFCLSATVWGIGGLGFSSTDNYESAHKFWLLANFCSIFAPVFYAHFIFEFLNLNRRNLVIYCYAISIIFYAIALIYPDIFIGELSFRFNEFYIINWQSKKNWIYLFFYIHHYWILLSYISVVLLTKFMKLSGIHREQTKYIIIGSVFGWIGGHGIFPSVLGFEVYPFSNILISLYPFIITYAVFRYQLLDLKVAIIRVLLFVFVYFILLGVPFVYGSKTNEWFGASLIIAVLSSVAPFVYIYVNQKAENILLAKQRKYQKTLENVVVGFRKYREISDLVRRTVEVLKSVMDLTRASIYLREPEGENYKREYSDSKELSLTKISKDSFLIEMLNDRGRRPIMIEELILNEETEEGISEVIQLMQELKSSVIVPCYLSNEILIGFIVLGYKQNLEPFSKEDIEMLNVYGFQTGANIENAYFYEEQTQKLSDKFHKAKLQSLGESASGLSHQIKNRMNVQLNLLEDLLLDLADISLDDVDDSVKQFSKTVEDNVGKVIKDMVGVAQLCHAFNSFAKTPENAPSFCVLNKVIEQVMLLMTVESNFKSVRPKMIFNLPDNLVLKANEANLQDMIITFFKNSLDALVTKKSLIEKGEWTNAGNWQPEIKVEAQEMIDYAEIIVSDNGTGVEKADPSVIFAPFYTTKGTENKGTGMGMYAIMKHTEHMNGSVEIAENIWRQGIAFKLRIPLKKD